MSTRSKLEEFAIEARKKYLVKSFYQRGTNQYGLEHPNAKGDGDEKGKGTGIKLDTDHGGSSADINGRSEFPGSGRVASLAQNFYNPSNKYEAPDMSANEADGQVVFDGF